MQRKTINKRVGWKSIVEEQGFVRSATDWDEGVYYSFKMNEIFHLERATNTLHQMYLEAVQRVIDKKMYDRIHIPATAIPLIEYSWHNESPTIYGRFDFAYDGDGEPKLLEYNADTPTHLLESAVIQWYWKEDCFPKCGQFNSIHERLATKWRDIATVLMHGPLYFAHPDNREDAMTAAYMADTAFQAGIEVEHILIPDIGWHDLESIFVDTKDNTIRNVFKVYPWKKMFNEEHGRNITKVIDDTIWIEPAWKMILSGRNILPILWEMFPNHPNLFRLDSYVVKPHTPVVGSWVIDGESAGIGIRESNRFVPHIIEK